ncbi:hypothetical protein HHL19_35300 [Streptomyces sp. R302]|uniref:hypothetical protein n=1 Tax=unclassified Streptomyces TaxID=2593676 RepID=UPI00145DBE78|nr:MULTISPECIES: hypothetical protein [unclassified Streptomyces]NML55191.1 hypothetical protein [Streptomyces sp. R301]NML83779.1 hypothetical protein [Streptomyces sp. R302]
MPSIVAPQRVRTPRKPTGLPNPPIILLTGPETTGKRYAAAEGSGSELIGTTYWIQVGGTSGIADYYGTVPGARYEIVPHDGSFEDILDAIRFAVTQPPAEDGRRNMVVIDDVSNVWDLLSDEVALVSRSRAERRARASGAPAARPDDPYVDEERDLWVTAKERWGSMLHLLRKHTGPSLLIARQEIVTVYDHDKPTPYTTRKIRAEKGIRAAVDAVVEFHGVGESYITALHVTSPHGALRPGWDRFEGVDRLLRRIGYPNTAETRTATESRPEAYLEAYVRRTYEQNRREAPAQRVRHGRGPDGPHIVTMVHEAMNDPKDPATRLQAIREEWGNQYLREVPTETKLWGPMNAADLITKALGHVSPQDEGNGSSGTGDQDGTPAKESSAGPTPPEAAVLTATKLEQRVQETTQPGPPERGVAEGGTPPDPEPASEDSAPPPPDPQAEEPPPSEAPEEISAAEEPQDRPVQRRRPASRPRGEATALRALRGEAEVQARLRMMTVGEHLGPIAAEGDPDVLVLKNFLVSHRAPLIEQLTRDGEHELAEFYGSVGEISLEITKRFESYFNRG